METKSNKFIAVTYELYTVDGEERHLVEKAPADKPFYFISGFGVAIDEFEKAVIDLAKGDSFDFTLTKEQAYGEYEEERVLTLDKSMFEVDGHFDKEHLFAGAVIPLQNEEGQRFMGTVVEIQDAAVVIDLNHPLAGHDLNFKGRSSCTCPDMAAKAAARAAVAVVTTRMKAAVIAINTNKDKNKV